MIIIKCVWTRAGLLEHLREMRKVAAVTQRRERKRGGGEEGGEAVEVAKDMKRLLYEREHLEGEVEEQV
jgi:hypothetical protein